MLDTQIKNDNGDFEDTSDSDECENDEIDELFSNCEMLKEIDVDKEEYVLHVSGSRFVSSILTQILFLTL